MSRGNRKRIVGSLILALAGRGAFADSDLLAERDRFLNRAALDRVAAAGELLRALDPETRACVGDESAPAADEPEVGVYECVFSDEAPSPEVSPFPNAEPSPIPSATAPDRPPPTRAQLRSLFARTPGSLILGASTMNDNYPGRPKPKGPDDAAFDSGATFNVVLSAVKVFGRDTKLGRKGDAVGVEIGTELFARDPNLSADTYLGYVQAQATQMNTGLPATVPDGPGGAPRQVYLQNVQWTDSRGPREIRQQTLDRQFVTVFKEWNRERFSVVGEVTIEKRDTDGKSLGNRLQNGWHRMGGGTYTYIDESAAGNPADVQMRNVGEMPAFGTNVEVVDVAVGPDVGANPVLRQYGSWAGSVGATVKKTKRVFRGSCELQTTVGGKFGVQGGNGRTGLDANSHVKVGSTLGVPLVKNRRFNDAKLALKTDAALVYFPRTMGAPAVGWGAGAELQGNFHTGSRGNAFQTAIRFGGPSLGERMRAIDDKDKRVTISLRYVFGNRGN